MIKILTRKGLTGATIAIMNPATATIAETSVISNLRLDILIGLTCDSVCFNG